MSNPTKMQEYKKANDLEQIVGFLVFTGCFTRHSLECFGKMRKIIESAAVTDICHRVVLNEQFACLFDAVFVDKIGKGHLGNFFEIPTKRRHR